jgi:hypothetical protein
MAVVIVAVVVITLLLPLSMVYRCRYHRLVAVIVIACGLR